MKEIIASIIVAVIGLAFGGTIIYVAVHFLSKYW